MTHSGEEIALGMIRGLGAFHSLLKHLLLLFLTAYDIVNITNRHGKRRQLAVLLLRGRDRNRAPFIGFAPGPFHLKLLFNMFLCRQLLYNIWQVQKGFQLIYIFFLYFSEI